MSDSNRRVATTVAILGLVAGSLLTFPASVPWMIAVWLAWFSYLRWRGRPAAVPLLACTGIVMTKQVDLLPLMQFLLLMMLVAVFCLLDAWKVHFGSRIRQSPTLAVVLWCVWSITTYQWLLVGRPAFIGGFDRTRPIVCIGDSLTSGVPPFGGYPADLAQHLSVPVVNLGQAGITSEEGLKLIPAIEQAKPLAVAIELGGHDFLRGRTRQSTRQNLEQIIDAARATGAHVVLMEVPRGFITDPFRGLEREIARQTPVSLIPDSVIRNLVLWSPIAPPGIWLSKDMHLSEDGLHPNSQGNRYMAAQIASHLKHVYGDTVLR